MSQTQASLGDYDGSVPSLNEDDETQDPRVDWSALTPCVRAANPCPLCGLNLGVTQWRRHIPRCPKRGDYPQ
jgi:hypothetical protein